MIGTLSKMKTELGNPVSYHLRVGESELALNSLVGSKVSLRFTGQILCTHCGRKTNKSFSQGYCYPCFRSLAQCDTCIMKPETCHFAEGTCREPEWAQKFCFTGHTVYLANSSGVKVGITRDNQVPTRWIDQGAIQALPVFHVSNRFHSGLLEIALGKFVADKTRWQAMLKNQVEPLDLIAERDKLMELCQPDLNKLAAQVGEADVQILKNQVPIEIKYPVLEYPTKISSHNFDKQEQVEGTLMGIKGQYLLFDTGVINIRKFTGYEIEVNVP